MHTARVVAGARRLAHVTDDASKRVRRAFAVEVFFAAHGMEQSILVAAAAPADKVEAENTRLDREVMLVEREACTCAFAVPASPMVIWILELLWRQKNVERALRRSDWRSRRVKETEREACEVYAILHRSRVSAVAAAKKRCIDASEEGVETRRVLAFKHSLQELLCVLLASTCVEEVGEKTRNHWVAAREDFLGSWRSQGCDQRDGDAFFVRGGTQRRRLFGRHTGKRHGGRPKVSAQSRLGIAEDTEENVAHGCGPEERC